MHEIKKSDIETFNSGDVSPKDFENGDFGELALPKDQVDILTNNAQEGDYVNFMGNGTIKMNGEDYSVEVKNIYVLGGRSMNGNQQSADSQQNYGSQQDEGTQEENAYTSPGTMQNPNVGSTQSPKHMLSIIFGPRR